MVNGLPTNNAAAAATADTSTDSGADVDNVDWNEIAELCENLDDAEEPREEPAPLQSQPIAAQPLAPVNSQEVQDISLLQAKKDAEIRILRDNLEATKKQLREANTTHEHTRRADAEKIDLQQREHRKELEALRSQLVFKNQVIYSDIILLYGL